MPPAGFSRKGGSRSKNRSSVPTWPPPDESPDPSLSSSTPAKPESGGSSGSIRGKQPPPIEKPPSPISDATPGSAGGPSPSVLPHTKHPPRGGFLGKSRLVRSTLHSPARPLPHPDVPPLEPGERDLYCYEQLGGGGSPTALFSKPPQAHAGGWALGVPPIFPLPSPMDQPPSARSNRSFGKRARGEDEEEEDDEGEEGEGEEDESVGLCSPGAGYGAEGEGEPFVEPDDGGFVGGQLSDDQRANLLDAVMRVCPRAVASLPLPRERCNEGAARRRQQQAAAREAAARNEPQSSQASSGGRRQSPSSRTPSQQPTPGKRSRTTDGPDPTTSPVATSPRAAIWSGGSPGGVLSAGDDSGTPSPMRRDDAATRLLLQLSSTPT